MMRAEGGLGAIAGQTATLLPLYYDSSACSSFLIPQQTPCFLSISRSSLSLSYLASGE
jgi:hypothetical protein